MQDELLFLSYQSALKGKLQSNLEANMFIWQNKYVLVQNTLLFAKKVNLKYICNADLIMVFCHVILYAAYCFMFYNVCKLSITYWQCGGGVNDISNIGKQ